MLSGGGRGRVLILRMMKVHEGEAGVVGREVGRSLSVVLLFTAFSIGHFATTLEFCSRLL